jgi:hypothetical protein
MLLGERTSANKEVGTITAGQSVDYLPAIGYL